MDREKTRKPGYPAPASENIPERCTRCAHWLGRYSGDPEDERCNRNWGHEPRHGDFRSIDADNAYGGPSFVTPDCRVPRWGPPIPPVDENGNPIGKASKPEMVDAFVPAKTGVVQLKTPHGTFFATSYEIRQYQMASDEKKAAIAKRLKKRNKKKEQVHKHHQETYKDKYGTNPRVTKGRENLSPWQRGDEKVPTGILALDLALRGGIQPGMRVNISGAADSGKSTLLNLLEGQTLRYYVSKSFGFYKELAEDLGQDPVPFAAEHALSESIMMIKPEGFELGYMIESMNLHDDEEIANALFDECVEIQETSYLEESAQAITGFVDEDNRDLSEIHGGDVNSWMRPVSYRSSSLDSVDAEALADESFGANDQQNVVGDNHQVGAQARILSELFRKGQKAMKLPMIWFLISQYRAKIGSYGGGVKKHRGNAHKYFTDMEFNMSIANSEQRKVSQGKKDTLVAKLRFGKMHTDSEKKRNDEVELRLRPGYGYTRFDNLIGPALDSDGGPLMQSGSWIKWITDEGEETVLGQGSDPMKVQGMLEEHDLSIDTLYEDTMKERGYGKFLYDFPEELENYIYDEILT